MLFVLCTPLKKMTWSRPLFSLDATSIKTSHGGVPADTGSANFDRSGIIGAYEM